MVKFRWNKKRKVNDEHGETEKLMKEKKNWKHERWETNLMVL